MKCPICTDSVLDEKHSHGIEVDVCPTCSGVWLSHGELEKLAAQSAAPMKQYEPLGEAEWSEKRETPADEVRAEWKSDRRQSERDDDDDHDDDDHDDDHDHDHEKKKRQKKSKDMSFGEMLEEVFDDLLDLDDLFDWG